ncbi:S41 family peptidase [Solibacillus sp. MA9]|uniref:S41 family peptidase n=1 Tax=Solibacillus palustris TaxID=2908203 RepID=A0ABS9U8L3_9BACL|nr:S41 family peptidase [Solibacillus sp. MA9]
MRKSRIFLLLVAMLIIVGIGYGYNELQTKDQKKVQADFAVVNELHDLITTETVYDITSEKLVEGALRGMADAINDPYSTYYTEQEAAFHKQTLASERVGIGVELSEVNGKFIVVAPVKASPAEKAGIRPLDELVQVNETRLEGKTFSEVMKLMQGKEGEKLELVLFRPELDSHLKLSVKREKLKNTTVQTQLLDVEGVKIGYVIVSLFAEKTAEEWKNALDILFTKDIEGLIIDVRDNPGGYLHSVAQMMSMFDQKESIFAYMQNHDGATEPLKTKANEAFEPYAKQLKSMPITILQNEGSASASEVFAGALQDWKRATLIGVTSFGKGTVQQTWELQNGGEVKLSTNKWLTPSKRWIHQVGIEPDLEVKQHPLYKMEMKVLKGRFEVGEYGEEVAYTQRVLSELGYNIARTDGFYDMDMANEVEKFRKKYDLQDGRHLDEVFFRELTMQLQKFKQDPVNDMQLQMGVSYIMHQLE